MSELKKFLLQPFAEVSEKLKSGNAEVYQNSYLYFTTPKFRAGQTGCSRRDINVWRREKLLPNNLEESKWNLFNVAECVWLRFVAMLKKFGVKQHTILQIKNEMFPTEINSIRNSFLAFKNYEHVPDEFNAIISEIISKIDNNQEEILSDLREINFSIWANITMLCCKLHMNFVAVIDEEGNNLIMNIGKPLRDTGTNGIESVLKQMSSCSFLLINIYELCKDFFENEKVLVDSNYYFGLMNSEEQRVITELRTGNYKMVTVKLDNGSITHLKLTKKESENEAMLRKLSRLFKTNDFKDIELTTRNGDIIKYSETDTIKLNKK